MTVKHQTSSNNDTMQVLDSICAYDYAAQCWLRGPSTLTLRIRQVAEELDMLRSPSGPKLAQSLGDELDTALAACISELAQLTDLANKEGVAF